MEAHEHPAVIKAKQTLLHAGYKKPEFRVRYCNNNNTLWRSGKEALEVCYKTQKIIKLDSNKKFHNL